MQSQFLRNWLTVGIVTVGVLALYLRLYFGVDFSDEGYYASLPVAMLRGHRFLLDELPLVQSFSLVTLPFVALYKSFQPNFAGVVLYLRHIYFLFHLAVASAIYLKFWGRRFDAVGASLILLDLSFVPYLIPAPSYNTLGVGFLVLFCLSEIEAQASDHPFRNWIGSLILLGLSILCYVPFLPLFFIWSFACLWTQKIRFWKQYFPVIMGLALVVGIGLVLYDSQILQRFQEILQFQSSIQLQLKGFRKVIDLLASLKNYAIKIEFAVWMIGLTWLSLRKRIFPALLIFTLFLLSLVIRHQFLEIDVVSFQVSFVIGALAILLGWFIKRKGKISELGPIWYLLAGAVLILLVSSGGWAGFILAAWPFVILAAARMTSKNQWPNLVFAFLAVSIVNFALLWVYSYCDQPIRDLNVTVKEGPYAGLRTNPQKNHFIEEVQKDFKAIQNENGRMMIFNDFPAGYLMTDKAPATESLWMMGLYGNSDFFYDRSIYAKKLKLGLSPDFVMIMKTFPYKGFDVDVSTFHLNDPVEKALDIEKNYVVLFDHPEYKILKKITASK